MPLPRYWSPPRNTARISRLDASRSGLVRLFLIGHRELDSALCAPSLENLPTAYCLHARSEPELSVPFPAAWLIGPFHGYPSIANCVYSDSEVYEKARWWSNGPAAYSGACSSPAISSRRRPRTERSSASAIFSSASVSSADGGRGAGAFSTGSGVSAVSCDSAEWRSEAR